MVVELGHPFMRRELHRLLGLPPCPAMDQFSLLEAVDRLGQGVVVRIPFAQ